MHQHRSALLGAMICFSLAHAPQLQAQRGCESLSCRTVPPAGGHDPGAATEQTYRFTLDTAAAAQAVNLSDWYAKRLTIHRVTAYTIPPLFAVQYLVGRELHRGVHSESGPADWVRPAHRTGAVLIGTAFAINATTGVWNLWAARHEPQDRVVRTLHGASMLVAAGGFTYAGVRLSEQAQFSAEKRSEHRRVATASMGLTLLSGTMMWWVNR